MDVEAPRIPTDRERALVDFLLEPDFPGCAELREQARMITVQTNCVCGCDSFSIHVDPSSTAELSAASETPTVWDHDRAIELFVMLAAGRLAGVEITYHDPAHPPAGIPDLSRLVLA